MQNLTRHTQFISLQVWFMEISTRKMSRRKDHVNQLGFTEHLKYSGELLVKAYSDVFDLPYTIIRPSALYGERCVSRRVGQIFIENAIQNLDIAINGNGEEKLDFTYIDDLINGIELMLQ